MEPIFFKHKNCIAVRTHLSIAKRQQNGVELSMASAVDDKMFEGKVEEQSKVTTSIFVKLINLVEQLVTE